MSLTCAIFDLDGLLVDTEPVYYQMNRELLRPYGKDIALADYAKYFSGGTLHFNLQQLIDRYELPVSFDEICAAQSELLPRLPFDKVEAKPGAQEVLHYLHEHGIRCYLATSGLPERANAILSNVGLLDLLDGFAYGSEVEHGKPEPDVFLLAAKRANANPDECVVFEDSEGGVRAAHAAGMRVVCVPDLKRPAPEVLELATAVVDSLSNALPLVEDWI